jgi:hypothetical protein
MIDMGLTLHPGVLEASNRALADESAAREPPPATQPVASDRALADESAAREPPPAVQPVPSRRTPAPGSRRPVKPRPAPERIPGVVELSENRL